MSDYSISVKVRNGNIRRAMLEAGISNAAELARLAGIHPYEVGRMLNMQELPFTRDGGWRPAVIKVCTVLNKVPDELFSDRQQREIFDKNETERFVSEAKMEHMLAPLLKPAVAYSMDIEEVEEQQDNRMKALALMFDTENGWGLTPRENKVIKKMFFDDMTNEEVAKDMQVSIERVRQMKFKALAKMKTRALTKYGFSEDGEEQV